jgi:hypothetical protein
MTTPVAHAETARAPKPSHRSAYIATAWMAATGVALGIAYFPALFSGWGSRDDEGVFVFALRGFLANHGSLYKSIWSDMYGSFYYLAMSTIYRLIGQQPTLENGRWIVLVLTVASGALFGASVWRVTKNLPCTLLCQTAAFLVLIQRAGAEPMHPGSLATFLVACVVFELSSYAVTARTAHLIAIGVATGALVMTKVNAGALVGVAVVFALVVGNEEIPARVQSLVAGLTALVPILLVAQNFSLVWVATLALLVVIAIVGLFLLTTIDQLPIPRNALVPVVSAAAAAAVVSLAFPLFSGTSLGEELNGVFIRPLKLPGAFLVPAHAEVGWLLVVVTVVGMYATFASRSLPAASSRPFSDWTRALLAVLALWLLGVVVSEFVSGAALTLWLPVILLLPAFAYCSRRSDPVRWALRATLIVALLEFMVVYPVAGSQVAWGTVALVVPCAIALAAAIDRTRIWRQSGRMFRGGTTAVIGIGLVLVSGAWPFGLWHTYLGNPRLNLPGAGLMRIDPEATAHLQSVAANLRAHCDAFYGVPNENSLYILSGVRAVSYMVANAGIAGMTPEQQARVTDALNAGAKAHERVCILRDKSQRIVLPPSHLTSMLKEYSKPVANVGQYAITVRPGQR